MGGFVVASIGIEENIYNLEKTKEHGPMTRETRENLLLLPRRTYLVIILQFSFFISSPNCRGAIK
jgi:hypothetical protein